MSLEPPAERARVRTALLGHGSIVKTELLPALLAHPQCDVVAVAEPRAEEHATLRQQLGPATRIVTDYHLVAADSVDLVVVALPNYLHAEASCHFLAQGVHVFCEKPMAVSVAECRKMLEEAGNSKTELMVGHVLRFSRPVQLLRHLLSHGVLGAPRYVACRQGTARGPVGDSKFYGRREEAGGGVVMDKGVHVLDLLEFLLGSVTVVGAHLVESHPHDDAMEEEVNIELSIPGSSHPSFYTLSRRRKLENRLTVVCDGGIAHLDLGDSQRLRMSCDLGSSDPDWMRVSFLPGNPFVAEIEHLLDVVQGRATCRSPGTAGLRAVEHVETIYRYLGIGRE